MHTFAMTAMRFRADEKWNRCRMATVSLWPAPFGLAMAPPLNPQPAQDMNLAASAEDCVSKGKMSFLACLLRLAIVINNVAYQQLSVQMLVPSQSRNLYNGGLLSVCGAA